MKSFDPDGTTVNGGNSVQTQISFPKAHECPQWISYILCVCVCVAKEPCKTKIIAYITGLHLTPTKEQWAPIYLYPVSVDIWHDVGCLTRQTDLITPFYVQLQTGKNRYL